MQGSFIRRSPLHLLRPLLKKETFQKEPCDPKGYTHSDIGFQLTQLPRWEGR